MAGAPRDVEARDFHEGEFCGFGRVTREHRFGGRALQREQRAIRLRRERGNAFQLLGDVGEIAFLGAPH